MNTHRKVVAWLHIGAAVFVASLVTGLWICAAMMDPATALLLGRPWAAHLLMGIGQRQMPAFPIGTALSVYTVWALLTQAHSPDPRVT